MLRLNAIRNLGQGAAVVWMLAAVFMTYEFFLNRKVFFITEGWWEYYALLIEHGSDPYVTDGLKITPLHAILTRMLQSVWGSNMLILRDIFSFIHLAQIAIILYWTRAFNSTLAAIFAVSLTTTLVIQGEAYISKDYHTTLALFLSLLLISTEKAWASGRHLWTFLNAALCALLFLTKQNVGLFVTIAVLIMTLIGGQPRPRRKAVTHVSTFILVYVSILGTSLFFWT